MKQNNIYKNYRYITIILSKQMTRPIFNNYFIKTNDQTDI